MAKKTCIFLSQQQFSSWALRTSLLACLMLALYVSPLFAVTFTAFEPTSYTWGSREPSTVTTSFTVLRPDAAFTLRLTNDGLTRGEVTITLNGVQIVGPGEFTQDMSVLEKSVGLAANNDLAVRLKGKKRGGVTVAITGVTGSPLMIISPTPGSVLNASSVLVRGVVDGTLGSEVGVTINDIGAEVNHGEFAAVVPLQLDTNVLTATIVTGVGTGATDAVTIDVPIYQEAPLQLLASPSTGVSPLTVDLQAVRRLERPITLFAFDFEGDGVVDYSSATFDTVVHTYTEERLFFPTLTVTDDLGNTFSATAIVNVYGLPDLVATWNAIKAALRSGDIEGAVRFIAETSQERYRAIFTTLRADLSDVDTILTDIQLIAVRGIEAEYAMLRTGADGVERSFYIGFVRDRDGVWRLETF